MRINLRGGGDIASNPARLRSRNITCTDLFLDMVARDVDAHIRHATAHGAGTPDTAPGSTQEGQGDSPYASPPQKSATGQEGGLNAKPKHFICGQCGTWYLHDTECHLCNPKPKGVPFDKTLDHAFGTQEWRKLTQAGNCYPHPPKDGAHP